MVQLAGPYTTTDPCSVTGAGRWNHTPKYFSATITLQESTSVAREVVQASIKSIKVVVNPYIYLKKWLASGLQKLNLSIWSLLYSRSKCWISKACLRVQKKRGRRAEITHGRAQWGDIRKLIGRKRHSPLHTAHRNQSAGGPSRHYFYLGIRKTCQKWFSCW